MRNVSSILTHSAMSRKKKKSDAEIEIGFTLEEIQKDAEKILRSLLNCFEGEYAPKLKAIGFREECEKLLECAIAYNSISYCVRVQNKSLRG